MKTKNTIEIHEHNLWWLKWVFRRWIWCILCTRTLIVLLKMGQQKINITATNKYNFQPIKIEKRLKIAVFHFISIFVQFRQASAAHTYGRLVACPLERLALEPCAIIQCLFQWTVHIVQLCLIEFDILIAGRKQHWKATHSRKKLKKTFVCFHSLSVRIIFYFVIDV